ncbi:MAG: hypothetical protein JO314_10975 [Acidobacteria bacterium]|nr:hypothetical protein [Acidobacteriota bacterium]
MYCSHCGSQTAEDLNYCKNCGRRNERNPLIIGNSSFRPLSVGAVAIGCVGLVGFFPIMRELLRNQVEPAAMVILMVAYLAAVVIMFSILVGHIWKNSGDIRVKQKNSYHPNDVNGYLRPPTTAQLPDVRERPASVTEHTTRTLDEVPFRER